MKERKSNLNKNTCSPISSNCVIWEGENIECISLCHGDTVSEVVKALADQICDLKGITGLSDLDLKCLVEVCEECPEPDKTLINVLTLLINKVCAIEDLLPDGDSTSPEVITTTIASCFVENDSNGDPVTTLELSEYVRRIGIKLCDLRSTVNAHTATLANYGIRITALENKINNTNQTVIPNVIPTCTFNDATPRSVDVVLGALEKKFCQLQAATGTPVDLSASVAKQCEGIKDQPKLNGLGTLGSTIGWVTAPTTVADAISNMWITICDLRAFVKTLENCCGGGCDSVIIDFDVVADEPRTTLTLFFAGGTSIPSGYIECSSGGSRLTVTDSAGNRYVTYVQVVSNKDNILGVAVNLTGTPINTNLTYTLTLEACVSQGSTQCNKTIVKTVTPPCGIVTGVTASLI